MSGPDSHWRERCDRYFSSMQDVDTIEIATTQKHRKETKKRKKTEKKYKTLSDKSREKFHNHPPPHHHQHVTTFTTKAEPLKGPVRWLSGVDLHGTSMLLRARSHLYCLFWITVSILASIVCGVFVYIFISDYLDKSTVFKMQMSRESSAPSPLSLVLCNSNLLRASSVSQGTRFYGLKNLTVSTPLSSRTVPTQSPNELLAGTKLQELMNTVSVESDTLPLDDLQQEFSFYSAMIADSDWDAVAEASLGLNFDLFPKALRMTATEMRMFGPDVKSDVLQCSKNGRQCGPGELTSELHRDLGHCAVVNLSLEKSWFSSADLTLDVAAEENIPGLSTAPPGIRVFVQTSSDTSPLTPGQALFVTAGDAMQITLQKTKELKRLEDEGKCESDNSYIRKTCERLCLESHAARVCGCSLGLDSPMLQLLINLGALSALTCGMSAVTAVELVWIFGKALSAIFCAVMKKEESDDQVEFIPPATMGRPPYLYDPPDTYRWVAYTGHGPPYPLPNQGNTGDLAPAIVMLPPPHLNTNGINPYYTRSGRPNFYFGDIRREDQCGRDNDAKDDNDDDKSRSSARGSSTKDAGLNMIVDEVREDSNAEGSPRVMPGPAALFSHPWERPGRHEPHRTVVNTCQAGDGAAGMPLFNVPVSQAAPDNGLNNELHLQGLSELGSTISSGEEGNIAPRSSSPLYRLSSNVARNGRGERKSKTTGKKETKSGHLPNGGIHKQAAATNAASAGVRPDGLAVGSTNDPGQFGHEPIRSKQTAWTEEAKHPSRHMSNQNKPNDQPQAMMNGDPFSIGLLEKPQFFPRSTPIQPNTWFVPQFRGMEIYDGKNAQLLPGGPSYYMYQGAVNGHI
ncbi:amiloride-sensitive cation channel 4-b [Plakobranchus ocellatus]|uniref:Amiloride-sensitive cation channel 4-b n=1 Tax=Plakobranchus ocellatus TaxID=259542 RepID=A0AAV4DUV8_9GAST|nr:amiloride-sensitive cation channel 4-b [Plakobranchus ocellatus]